MYTFIMIMSVLLLSCSLVYEESDLNGKVVYDVR
jgi:hypothetical protein